MCRRMKQTINLLLVTLVGLVALQTIVEQIEAAAFDDLPEEQKEAAMAFLRRAVSETDLDPVEIIRRGLDRSIQNDGDRASSSLTASRNSEEHPASSVASAEGAPEDPATIAAEPDNPEAAADPDPESATEPATEQATEPATEQATEPVAEQAAEPSTEPAIEPQTENPEPESEPTIEAAPTEEPSATVAGSPVTTEPQSESPEPGPEPETTSPSAPVEPEASAPPTPSTEQPETHSEQASNAGSVTAAPDEPEITSPTTEIFEQSNLPKSDDASQVGDTASEHNSGIPDEDPDGATDDVGESTLPSPTSPLPADPVTNELTNELDVTDESEGPSSPPELMNNEQMTPDTGITDSISPVQDGSSSTSKVGELQSQNGSHNERALPTESVQEPTQATNELPSVTPPVAQVPRAISQTMTTSSISTTGGTAVPENSQTTSTSSVKTTGGAILPEESQTTTTTNSVTTNDGTAMPEDVVSENVYIDNSDPNDPKEVRIKNRRRSRIDANGVSHEHHESRSSTSLRNKPNSFKRRSSRRSSFTRSSSNRNFPNRWGSFSQVPSVSQMAHLPPIPPIPPMPPMPAMPTMPAMPPMMSFGFPMATNWPGFYGSQDFDEDDYGSFGSGAFASAGAGASAGAFSGFQPGYYAYPNEGYISKKQAKKMRRKQEKAVRRAANFGF